MRELACNEIFSVVGAKGGNLNEMIQMEIARYELAKFYGCWAIGAIAGGSVAGFAYGVTCGW